MIDQYETSYSIPWMVYDADLSGTPAGAADARMWASQIREAMGEERELDAGVLEESWKAGLPIDVELFRERRERSDRTDERVSFAELSRFATFSFTQATGEVETLPAGVSSTPTSSAYAASWLCDSVQEPLVGRRQSPGTEESGRVDSASGADAFGKSGVMTYRGACELLCVRSESSAAQIKTAYRKMASTWHPDQFEQSNRTVRTLATEHMAAINEAYRLLRGSSACAGCVAP